MNPLAIYKKLPRIDCGECSEKTCMAFAVKVTRRERAPSECTQLSGQSISEIQIMLPDISDWKERRLEELFKEIARMNFQQIAEGIGAVSEKDRLKINYMGRKVTLSHSDFRDTLNIWDKLLILMYIKKAGDTPPSGKWTAFRDLKNGLLRAAAFQEICEIPLARMFEKNREAFFNKLVSTGAENITGFSADYSFLAYPLPKIRFLVLLWSAQEDFEPACKVLLDTTATDYLDVEALLYLGQAFVNALKTS